MTTKKPIIEGLSEGEVPIEKREYLNQVELLKDSTLLRQSLTSLEYYLLCINLLYEKPLTVKDYYNRALLDVYGKFLKVGLFGVGDHSHIKLNIDSPEKRIVESFCSPFANLVHTGKGIQDQPRMVKLVQSLNDNKSSMTKNDFYSYIKERLQEFKLDFPSYEKVKNNLDILGSWGFIARRFEDNKKADHYWIINPRFYVMYKDYLPGIFIKGLDVNLTIEANKEKTKYPITDIEIVKQEKLKTAGELFY